MTAGDKVQVAMRCADPTVAASVATVVAAAGGVLVDCRDSPSLASAWRSLDVAVLDVDAAVALTDDPLPAGPPVIVVFDDSAALRSAWTAGAAVRAGSVIALPSGEPMLLDALLAAPNRRRAGGRVVGIVGSGGGAGASTLAVVLAAAAVRDGRPVALVDADRGGGGLDLLLGAEAHPGPRWPDLLAAASPGVAASRPMIVDGISLLSWDRSVPGDPLPARATGEVIEVLRAAHDLVVFDAGRRRPGAVASACDTVLVVCGRQVRSVAAAAGLVARLAPVADARVVAGGAGVRDLAADDVAAAVGAALAAVLPADAALARAAAAGRLHRLAGRNRTMRSVRRLLAGLLDPPAGPPDAPGGRRRWRRR